MGCNQQSKGFVLVVKDEPLLYLNALDTVDDKGSEVLEAGSADAVLRQLEAHGYDVRPCSPRPTC
jgi:hypothetical protein